MALADRGRADPGREAGVRPVNASAECYFTTTYTLRLHEPQTLLR